MAFTTSRSLLNRVRSGDEVSWQEFYDTYKPLIILCGKDCGLTEDENNDLVQLVMGEIFKKDSLNKFDLDQIPSHIVFKHDPAKGRFRHYFKKIVHYQAISIYNKRNKNFVSIHDPADTIQPAMLSVKNWENIWEEEWRKHLFSMALRELQIQVSPVTYVVFEMYALHGRKLKEVMDFFNISAENVYTIKSRCIAKLREIIKNMEEKK